MPALRAEIDIPYDERTQGTLQLFRTQKQLDGTAKDVEILKEYGVPYQLLDRAGYLRYEPALADVQAKFVGEFRMKGRHKNGSLTKHHWNAVDLAEHLDTFADPLNDRRSDKDSLERFAI